MQKITTEQRVEGWKSQPQVIAPEETLASGTRLSTEGKVREAPFKPGKALTAADAVDIFMGSMLALSLFQLATVRFPPVFEHPSTLSILLIAGIYVTTVALFRAFSTTVSRLREYWLAKKKEQSSPVSQTNPHAQQGEVNREVSRVGNRVKGMEAVMNCLFVIGGIAWSLRSVMGWFGHTDTLFLSRHSDGKEMMVLHLLWAIVVLLSAVSSAALAPVLDHWLASLTQTNTKDRN